MTAHRRFDTRSIHAGEAPDLSTGAHGVPLYQNTTYAFDSVDQIEAWQNGKASHFHYARDGNPTVCSLELKLTDLEGAEAAVATATGMAAISATLLHVVPAGGHLVAARDIYALTRTFLSYDLPRHGASVDLVDVGDIAAVEAAITPDTRAIFCEVFSNPEVRVADLPALAEVARRHGVLLIVDNTFLSPALLRPIEHGADLVIHSATKYLSGHGNALGGVVCGRRGLIVPLIGMLSRLGATMSPFNAWMLLAGVKTLGLRIERHSSNAARLAALLSAHPAIENVSYPGLPAHPEHALARSLVGDRFGGMLSIDFRGGTAAVREFLDALELCTIAVSLGDCATLVWPISGTNRIRVSVGLEDPVDLEADLTHALTQLQASGVSVTPCPPVTCESTGGEQG